MNNIIDLDKIISQSGTFWPEDVKFQIRIYLKEAIQQALILASENALVESYYEGNTGSEYKDFRVKKQSILDVEKLIK